MLQGTRSTQDLIERLTVVSANVACFGPELGKMTGALVAEDGDDFMTGPKLQGELCRSSACERDRVSKLTHIMI